MSTAPPSPQVAAAAPAPLAEPAVWSGHLALAAVQFCFGLFHLFGKWAMAAFEPEAVAAWRILVGTLVLGGLAAAVHGRAAWPRRGDWPRLALCSFLGIALNQILYLEGLSRSTTANAGLIMAMIPVFVMLLGILFGVERAAKWRLVGLALAMAGALPIVLAKDPELGPEHGFGNLLMLTNALSFSGFLILSRPLARSMPPLALVAWVFGLSTLSLPYLLVRAPLLPEATIEPKVWWSFAWILGAATVLGYLLNAVALRRVPASTVAIYVFTQPLIAMVAATSLGGERLDAGFFAAAGAVLAGVALVSGILAPDRWFSRQRRAALRESDARSEPPIQPSTQPPTRPESEADRT